MSSETEPLLTVSTAIGKKRRDETSVQFVGSSCKLDSPLKTKEDNVRRGDWLRSATAAVIYYAVAASFGAILSGCTLAYPSSAVLDLTDSEPRKEYKFDARLSDVFGVSHP